MHKLSLESHGINMGCAFFYLFCVTESCKNANLTSSSLVFLFVVFLIEWVLKVEQQLWQREKMEPIRNNCENVQYAS